MWQVRGKQLSGTWLDLEPVPVLYDFDGPRIFVCKDTMGVNYFLAYQCGEEASTRTMRFLVVPCSENLERQLTAGEINLHDALMRPRAWIFDLDFQWILKDSWEVQVEDVPATSFEPGVKLSAFPARGTNQRQ